MSDVGRIGREYQIGRSVQNASFSSHELFIDRRVRRPEEDADAGFAA